MPEAAVELSSFYDAPEIDVAEIESFADQAYATARARERFEELTNAYRTKVEAGQGDPLRLALGLHILGRYSDALERFKESRDNKFRRYYAAQAALALGRLDDAARNFELAVDRGWDAFECEMQGLVVQIRAGDLAAAEKRIAKHERAGQERAEWHYVRGLLAEQRHARTEALEHYEKALALNPDHAPSMFRAAWIYDISGEDEQAVGLYERLATQPRAHINALLNLAVIYEDRGKFEHARQCLLRVLAAYPNHTRARLFLKDVESSRTMVIDDSVERKAATRSRLLETPISEFELSVRARNCLKKMRINTLGDLMKLTEAELLAFKNLGEASLNEIKAVLVKRGLQLGQSPEEIDPAVLAQAAASVPKVNVPPGRESLLAKPVSELELSVRARRCLQRLNVVTVGDLLRKTESDLLATRNFGQTSLSEIKGRLAEMGLHLLGK